MYTYNRDIYVYTYIYIYVCMIYMYTHIINVCVYILLNGVNAYLTFGTGFSFFHFPPPPPTFYVVCFLFVILRGTVFRGHPVNAFREIRFECTHLHTQCCSCVYAIDYFGLWMRGTKGKQRNDSFTDSGTVVICNTCTHTYNTHAYTCKAIQAINTKKKLYEYNVCSQVGPKTTLYLYVHIQATCNLINELINYPLLMTR